DRGRARAGWDGARPHPGRLDHQPRRRRAAARRRPARRLAPPRPRDLACQLAPRRVPDRRRRARDPEGGAARGAVRSPLPRSMRRRLTALAVTIAVVALPVAGCGDKAPGLSKREGTELTR